MDNSEWKESTWTTKFYGLPWVLEDTRGKRKEKVQNIAENKWYILVWKKIEKTSYVLNENKWNVFWKVNCFDRFCPLYTHRVA